MESVRFLSAGDLKAVSHPVRQRILALMVRRGELSGREVADLVPEAPANPYYHLDVLREAGLIRETRREKRRGSYEKYYAPVARTYSMDPGELVGRGDSAAEVRTGVLSVARNGAEDALEGLARALERDVADDVPFVNLCTLRLRPDRAEDLRARLRDWIEDAVVAGRECAPAEGRDDAGAVRRDGAVTNGRERAPREDADGCVEFTFYQLFFHSGAA